MLSVYLGSNFHCVPANVYIVAGNLQRNGRGDSPDVACFTISETAPIFGRSEPVIETFRTEVCEANGGRDMPD